MLQILWPTVDGAPITSADVKKVLDDFVTLDGPDTTWTLIRILTSVHHALNQVDA
jgi:hypothetical protein